MNRNTWRATSQSRWHFVIVLTMLLTAILFPGVASACSPSSQIRSVAGNQIGLGEIQQTSDLALILFSPKWSFWKTEFNRFSQPQTALILSQDGVAMNEYFEKNVGDCGNLGRFVAIAEIGDKKWFAVDLRNPVSTFLITHYAVLIGIMAFGLFFSFRAIRKRRAEAPRFHSASLVNYQRRANH